MDGRRVKVAEQHRYILLNKPRGYVTTRSDPQRRPTVIDLLRGVREYVYPVGRLDYESEGLLLLTNDGDLAARLTHPRHGVDAHLRGARARACRDARDSQRLRARRLIDGTPDGAGRRQADRRKAATRPRLAITIREGRNRQVRNMCEAIGHPVDALKRVAIGPIRDSRLKPGQWRELTEAKSSGCRRCGADHAPDSSTADIRRPDEQMDGRQRRHYDPPRCQWTSRWSSSRGSSPPALRLLERQHLFARRLLDQRGGSKPSASAMSSTFGRSLRSFSPNRIRNSFVVAYRNGRPTTLLAADDLDQVPLEQRVEHAGRC